MQRAFGLGPALVTAGLTAADCQDVQTELFTHTISLPPLEEFASPHVSTLSVAPAFAARDTAQRQAYVDGIMQALAQYRTASGGYDCTFASWIMTPRR